jgi:hypothetical protein
MAVLRQNAALNMGNAISNSGVRIVQTDFEALPGNDTPLVQWIGYGPGVNISDNGKYEWIIDQDMPQTVTVTAQVTNTTTANTLTMSTSDVASLQVGHILVSMTANSSGTAGELLRVIDVTSTSGQIQVTRAYAGTTVATQATSVVLGIMSPAYLDTTTFVESPKGRGDFVFNYFQQVMYETSETDYRTAMQSYLTKQQDEISYDIMKIRLRAVQQLERTLLYSVKQQPTASNEGLMDGLITWIATNKTQQTGLLTATDIANTLDAIFDFDNTNRADGLTVVGTRKSKRIWDAIWNSYFEREGEPNTNDLGITVESVHTNWGDLHYMTDQAVREGELLFLDKNDLKILPLNTESGAGWKEFKRDPAIQNVLQRQQAYYGHFSLRVGNEKRHGKIYGPFTTTLASYAGAI